jgi:hypothetical protein|tara:strand:+ start:4721 stop:5092 length:372 start_codon:yes stop_codon:yes gene_type:complete
MKIFEVTENNKTWMKDGVEMCSKDCCGAPVTECTCGPECKHCDCYKINEAGYGIRQGVAANRKAATAMTNTVKRQTNTYANQGREAEIKQTHAMRKEIRRTNKAPTGVPARMLMPQTPAGPGQ